MNRSEEYELEINEIEHFKNIMKNLNLMRKEGIGCDLTIKVQEKTIHANKDVICAASEYFKAMFSHDTIESREGIVKMEGIGYSAVEKCMDFIYTGRLLVSVDKCDEILYSANLMQLHQICEQMRLFLQSQLDIDTFFEIKRMAVKYSINSLKAFCDEFAISNVAALSKLDEFNYIDIDYLKTLISANISTTRTKEIRMEDVKLGITIQWVKAKQDDRMRHLIELLDQIDFSKVTLEYCKYLVDEESLCRTSNDLMRILLLTDLNRQGIASHGLPDVCVLSASKQSPNALVLFDETTENVLAHFPSQGVARTLIKYQDSIKKKDFTACSSGNRVFIFLSNKCVYYFDIDKPVWQCAPEMLYSHGELLRCTTHYGHAYVGGNGYLEKWDMQIGSKWQNVDLDGNNCDEVAMIEFEKSFYLIGGRNPTGTAINEVVRKCPYTKWRSISPMNMARADASVVVHEDNMYVIGRDTAHGFPKQYNFEIYSSATCTWTNLIIKSQSPIDSFSLQQVDDQLYAVLKNCIKAFDPKEMGWNEIEICLTKNIWILGTTTAHISI